MRGSKARTGTVNIPLGSRLKISFGDLFNVPSVQSGRRVGGELRRGAYMSARKKTLHLLFWKQ